WRLLHQPHSTQAMQAPGHRHPPQEAESLRLEPPPPPRGGLDSRPAGAEGAPTLPQVRRLAGDEAPREGKLPRSGQLHPTSAGWPSPAVAGELLHRRPHVPSIECCLAEDGSSAGGGLNEDSVRETNTCLKVRDRSQPLPSPGLLLRKASGSPAWPPAPRREARHPGAHVTRMGRTVSSHNRRAQQATELVSSTPRSPAPGHTGPTFPRGAPATARPKPPRSRTPATLASKPGPARGSGVFPGPRTAGRVCMPGLGVGVRGAEVWLPSRPGPLQARPLSAPPLPTPVRGSGTRGPG
ncbi:unnamed protein product, partial [Rangifer tarandus platyrhynchus]